MHRDKQYYVALFEKTLLQYKVNEQYILRDFYEQLNRVVSSTLGAMSGIASSKLTPQNDSVTSLFLAAWHFVPVAGTYINKALTMASNQYEEAKAQRINSVLTNFAHKDETADIFCYQAVIYHHFRILKNELEQDNLEILSAELKAIASAVMNKFLPEKIKLSPARETLIEELLVQLMEGLNAAVDAKKSGDLVSEELGKYLAQRLIVVNDAHLINLAFNGEFHQLSQIDRYTVALEALRLSQFAYEDKALIEPYIQQWGYELKKPESFFYQFANGNRCILLANNDTVICVFRGSSKSLEFSPRSFANILESMWDCKDGLGHRLSYHAKFPPKRFIFIGHSTGGALALLASTRFFQQYKQHQDKLTVFTFGQPIATKALSQEFTKNVYRFTHPNDPIPMILPEALGYVHIGFEYSLPDVTQIFNWEDKSSAAALLEMNQASHQLLAYQERLTEHARSHNDAALPAYINPTVTTLNTLESSRNNTHDGTIHTQPINQLYYMYFISQKIIQDVYDAVLPDFLKIGPRVSQTFESLGSIVFRETFVSQSLKYQLETLHSLTQKIIKELYQSGGVGFSHPIKNALARLEKHLKYYQSLGDIGLVMAAENLSIWLKVAACQKKDKDAFKDLFSIKIGVNYSAVLKNIDAIVKDILGDSNLASLLLIAVFLKIPNFLRDAQSLRCALSDQPLTHYLAQIAVLDLLVSIAKEKNDIEIVLLGQNDEIDLTYWLQSLPEVLPNDKKSYVDDYVKQILIQLQAIQDHPILRALIKGYQENTSPKNLLFFALDEVSRNEDLIPGERLRAIQIRHTVKLLPEVKATFQGLEDENNTVQHAQSAASRVLTYLDYLELGENALLTRARGLAKSSFINAYHLLKINLSDLKTENKTEIDAQFMQVTSKIISILWEELNSKALPWEKSLIYLEILRYDEQNIMALNGLFELGLGDAHHDFEKHLPHVGTKLTSEDAKKYLVDHDDAVLLQTSFNGTWVLNKKTIEAFDKRAPARKSTHAVAEIGPLYVKENPGLVGLAFAAWALSRWVFLGLSETPTEWGLIPVQPAKILRKDKPPVIVQLSPTISGDNVQELLSKNLDPQALKTLSPLHFSALMIINIMLNMSDARDANFVLSLKQLFSIDNDCVFVRDEMQSGLFGQQMIVKNLVFCLAQMQENVDKQIAQHFIHSSFAPLSRIRAWLFSVFKYNQTINKIFSETEQKELFERTNENEQVVVSAFFDSQGILQPATKLFMICDNLKKSSLQTHQDLFKAIRKNIAQAYEEAFMKNNTHTLLGRMQSIGGLTGLSLSTTGKVIRHNLGKSLGNHNDFVKAQRNPREVLRSLPAIEKDSSLLRLVLQEIVKGDMSSFSREIQIQEMVLENLNEKHYSQSSFTIAVHQMFIQAISPSITCLIFRDNPYLTDDDLLKLVSRLPNLTDIKLINCPRLTGYTKGWTGEYDWLTEFSKRGNIKITIWECLGLEPRLLDIIPEIAKIPSVSIECGGILLLLRLVAEGEQDQAEILIKANLQLLFQRGDVTDLSKRKFKNITAFQYAVWALDWHMWTMILKYLPLKEAKAQAEQLSTGDWVKEHGEKVSWQSLIDALKLYNGKIAHENKYDYIYSYIKLPQFLLPVHVVNQYCRIDQSFHPVPYFDKPGLPRTRQTNMGEWFKVISNQDNRYGVVRMNEEYAMAVEAVVKTYGTVYNGMGAEYRYTVSLPNKIDEKAMEELLFFCNVQHKKLIISLQQNMVPVANIFAHWNIASKSEDSQVNNQVKAMRETSQASSSRVSSNPVAFGFVN
ncbi:MAG: lipase family protein [Legionellales bacterium]|jgi:hypothetical protein